MSYISRVLFLVLFLIIPTVAGLCQKNTLTVTLWNIRSGSGLVRLALYDHSDQFPHDPVKSYTFEKTSLREGEMQVALMDIQPGTYAITVLDDEDENDHMKYNLLHMPKEGYGFSNDFTPRFKSPSFEQCSFKVGEGNSHYKIKMQYFRDKT